MQPVTLNGGWAGFQRVLRDNAAAASDLISILDAVDVPIVVLRRDLTIAGFNKVAADVLGLSPSDIGPALRDVLVLAGLPRLQEQCNQVIAAGVESRVDFRDGEKWFVVRIAPCTKGDRQVACAVLTFTNVTAFRASIDQAIYERESTKAILNTVGDPLVVLSADQRIQSGNRAFYAKFRVSRDETQDVPLYELGNGAFELAPLRTQLEAMRAGSDTFQPVEVNYTFPEIGQKTLMLDARPLSLPGHSERRVLLTFRDITARKQAEAAERKRAQEKLRHTEAFLAEAQFLSRTGSFSWRVATDEITWSEQLYRIYELEIGVPVTLEVIRTRVHPEDVSLLETMVDQARGGANDVEWQCRLLMPDHSIKYLHAVAHATRDQDGQLEYIAAVQDVTQRRLSEEALAKARSELAHVARVTTLGALTASIAHEVNQPLTAITNNSNACLRLLAAHNLEPEVLRQALGEIVADGARASAVIGRIRGFIKKTPAEKHELDINEVIQEVLALTGRELYENRVVVERELTKALPLVLADRVQLQQVLLNLFMNGIESMNAITTRPRLLLMQSRVDEYGDVLVAVADSGTGLGQEADRVFTPFFTTKANGMGMGLSISRSLIEGHGGRLWAEPNVPYGAVFSFTVPRFDGARRD